MTESGGRVADNIDDVDLSDLINGQTGKVTWPEIERLFAKGALVKVSGRLDLVDVAQAIIDDDKALVEGWMDVGDVAGPTVDDARSWQQSGRPLWAVVAPPWVLIQEPKSH